MKGRFDPCSDHLERRGSSDRGIPGGFTYTPLVKSHKSSHIVWSGGGLCQHTHAHTHLYLQEVGQELSGMARCNYGRFCHFGAWEKGWGAQRIGRKLDGFPQAEEAGTL